MNANNSISFEDEILSYVENVIKKIHPSFYDQIINEIRDKTTDSEKMNIIFSRLTQSTIFTLSILRKNCTDYENFSLNEVAQSLHVLTIIIAAKMKFIYMKSNGSYFFPKDAIVSSVKNVSDLLEQIIEVCVYALKNVVSNDEYLETEKLIDKFSDDVYKINSEFEVIE